MSTLTIPAMNRASPDWNTPCLMRVLDHDVVGADRRHAAHLVAHASDKRCRRMLSGSVMGATLSSIFGIASRKNRLTTSRRPSGQVRAGFTEGTNVHEERTPYRVSGVQTG